jgi:hypothetical protein
LYYGMVEGVVILTFCLISWKAGWTKAPVNENLCTVIATTYEIECRQDKELEMTTSEVVIGKQHDLVLAPRAAGDYVVDEGTTMHDVEKAEDLKQDNKQMNRKSTEAEGDDLTVCSVLGHDDNGGKVADGIMIIGSPGTMIQRRQIRLYDALEAPESPKTEASSVSSVGDQMTIVDSDSKAQTNSRFGRRTLSGMRARATGYRPQAPFPPDDDENDLRLRYLRDTRLPMNLSSDDEADNAGHPSKSKAPVTTVAATSKSAVTKVTAATCRARRNYETVGTAASPPNALVLSDSPTFEVGSAAASFDDSLGDCSL